MSIIHLPNGLGDTTGYSFATTSPLEVNGNVWYVHYSTGTDAASPAGQNRQAPLQTLQQAVTNCASGDIIVLLDGHEETITSVVSINKDITIVGAGTSGGYPTAKLTNNQAADRMLDFNGSYTSQLMNVWLKAEAQANSEPKLRVDDQNGNFIISDCYIECGQYDDNFALEIDQAAFCLIRNTTFISTATSVATQPVGAISVDTTAITIRAVLLDGVVVDGGTYGWSNYHAIELSQNGSNQPYLVNIKDLSLLRGSDMRIDSNAIGWVNAPTQTGGCRIDWDGVT